MPYYGPQKPLIGKGIKRRKAIFFRVQNRWNIYSQRCISGGGHNWASPTRKRFAVAYLKWCRFTGRCNAIFFYGTSGSENRFFFVISHVNGGRVHNLRSVALRDGGCTIIWVCAIDMGAHLNGGFTRTRIYSAQKNLGIKMKINYCF